jgi:hypothetical protein
MAQFHPPKIYCVHLMAPSAGWHPPEPGCIGQTVNATISFRGSTAALLLPITRYEYQRLFAFYAFCRKKKKADERTRTADLLITSVRSGVSGRCRGLQIPHRKRVFCSLHCSPLQGIASGLGSN